MLAKGYFNGADSGAMAVPGHSQGGPNPPPGAVTPALLNDAEMSFARAAWTWLVARPEVLIGGNKRWNRLGLDEVLALPEPQPAEDESATADSAHTQVRSKGRLSAPATPQKQGRKPRKALEVQPRIYVTEDALWKRLTRHGVDYKRIPNLEWKCLLGIASTRRDGILQGDLRRLVGQDQRSVPKRTDFLAEKGYIVKRPLFAQGTKTSKLWLTDLAPAMFPGADGSAPTKGVDMSKAALTRDTEPVFWHKKWTGKDIDIEAFAEALLAIVKAWGVMKYSDLRLKMGLEDLRWQMRAMSRMCRKVADMGILRYVAATFIDSRKIWKDCIKFIRDPTEEEWETILATGKKTSNRGTLSRNLSAQANAASTNAKPAGPLKSAEDDEDDGEEPDEVSASRPMPSGWVPEKPIVHTLFDAVRDAGPRGISNPQLSSSTVGYHFRRYVSSALTNSANNQQPAHLKKFQISSELVRHGKTSTYMYSTKQAISSPGDVDNAQAESASQAEDKEGVPNSSASPPMTPSYGFRTIQPRALAGEKASTFSALSQAARKGCPKFSKQRRLRTPEPVSATGTAEGRSPKRRRLETDGATKEEESEKVAEKLPGKPPGAYIGEPGSLNPRRRTLGRPRKSLVIIFKSEKLKSPDYLITLPTTTTGFIPVNEGSLEDGDKVMAEHADITFGVQYNGIAGELSLPGNDRKLVFYRQPGETGKGPLTIPLTHLLEDPSIRPVPGGDDNSLVCTTTGDGDEESSWTYIFVFKDDPHNHEQAVSLRDRIVAIRAGTNADEAPEEPPKPTTGGRGRPGKKPGGAGKPFKCDKCGGAWKNDMGLKYHLTKAQNPCNPSYVAAPVVDRPKKRRRMPSLSPEPEKQPGSGDGPATPAGRNRRGRLRAKPVTPRARTARKIARLIRGVAPNFRGLAIDDDRPRERYQEQPILSEAPRNEPRPSMSPVKPSIVALPAATLEAANPQAPSPALPMPGSPVEPSEKVEVSSPLMSSPNPPSSPVQPPEKMEVEAEASVAVIGSPSRPGTKNPREHISEAAQDIPSVTPRPRPPIPATVAPVTQQEILDQLPDPPPTENQMTLKPFKPRADYSRISVESKVKTVQALDIIEYLLESNGGVFPGDKALFYAVIRVFLKEFGGQNPPTLKNCKIALKILENKKKAREIGHAFRESSGQLAVITMLVKTELDPSSILPAVLKGKMQDAYPNIFIPAAFSPSKEELKMLQELDREPADAERSGKNGPKFRQRRDQTGEVEVLSAPYYSKGKSSGVVERRSREVGEGESGKRSERQTTKRQRELDADELGERGNAKKSRADSGPVPKPSMVNEKGPSKSVSTRREQMHNGTVERNSEDRLTTPPAVNDLVSHHDSTTPPTANNARHAAVEAEGGKHGGSGSSVPTTPPPPANLELKPTSVVDAIRTFGLLPAKRGPRKGHTAAPRKLAVRNNPGLDSLPPGFFTFATDTLAHPQPCTPHVRFLEPNTHLDSHKESASEDEDLPQTPDRSSTGTPPDTSPIDLPERERAKGFAFVPSAPLKEESQGAWPTLKRRHFIEGGNQSFVLEGSPPDRNLILSQYMPADVDDIMARTKADLDGSTSWADPLLGEFCQILDRIEAWELSEDGNAVLSGDMVAPDCIYINVSAPPARASMSPVTPVWSAENMFEMQTLPYDLIVEGKFEDWGAPSPKPRGRPRKNFSGPLAMNISKRNGRKSGKALRVVPLNKNRHLTAYPKSADEFIATHDSDEGKEDWYSESTRLSAFVCITTLMGGVGQSVDWGLVLRLFPKMTLSGLRRFWITARKEQRSSITNLTQKFRKEFLRAYENNELPPIDYENVIAYDWKMLTLWTRELLSTESVSIRLPASLEELGDQKLAIVEPAHKSREWRETYFMTVRSYFDRFQDASSQAISIPIDNNQETIADSLTAAMSWIRALCVTPVPRYSSQAVKERLNQLCGLPQAERTRLMEDASIQLRKLGMIAKSTRQSDYNRIWKLSGRVIKVLDKTAQEDKYARAVEFKKELDACFREGRKAVVRYVCNDGATMAILNLQAHQRIGVETTGQPSVPMGYEPFNYETRKYPKRYHHFRMHMSPAASYLDDADPELAALRARVAAADPPRRGPRGEIPLWCDVFGRLDRPRWCKCLGAALFMLSCRGGAGAAALAAALQPVLMAFEAQMILDWGEGVGLLRRRVEGTALAPTEWWWLAVEAQRGEGDRGAPTVSGVGGDAGDGSGPCAPGPAVSGAADDGVMDVDG